jgi:hypothetical protein
MVNKNYLNLFEGNPSLTELQMHPDWKDLISSEVFVYQLLNRTSFSDFDSLPKEILAKPAIVLSALEKFFLKQIDIPGELSHDISFCMYCCNLEPKYAKLFSSLMEKNENLALWYINEFKAIPIAEFLPHSYCSDETYAQLLIKNNLNNYAYLSEDIRNNTQIFQAFSLSRKAKVYKYAGEKINSNWQLSSQVIVIDPSCYQYADASLQKDPNFYLDILSKIKDKSLIGSLLLSADNSIQDNEHCVWQTILLSPKSLSLASERLLNSTSFAQQVISDMNISQVEESFEHWGLHVKNSGVILEDLLPKILQANSLVHIGPLLKENFGFMLKSILIDSKQTLENCAPSLLCKSEFIIKAYHTIDDKNLHKDRYDESSEQSTVFDYIPEKITDDAEFITDLYKEFKDVFVSIIFPKINQADTTLIHYLNACNQTQDGLLQALEKMLLKDKLQQQLTNEHLSKKKPKI